MSRGSTKGPLGRDQTTYALCDTAGKGRDSTVFLGELPMCLVLRGRQTFKRGPRSLQGNSRVSGCLFPSSPCTPRIHTHLPGPSRYREPLWRGTWLHLVKPRLADHTQLREVPGVSVGKTEAPVREQVHLSLRRRLGTAREGLGRWVEGLRQRQHFTEFTLCFPRVENGRSSPSPLGGEA